MFWAQPLFAEHALLLCDSLLCQMYCMYFLALYVLYVLSGVACVVCTLWLYDTML